MKRTLLVATDIAGALKTTFPAPVNFLSIVLVIGGHIIHLLWRKKQKGEISGEQDLWRKGVSTSWFKNKSSSQLVHSHATAAESDRPASRLQWLHVMGAFLAKVTRWQNVHVKQIVVTASEVVNFPCSLEAMKYSKSWSRNFGKAVSGCQLGGSSIIFTASDCGRSGVLESVSF
jgi:hypothetical protein